MALSETANLMVKLSLGGNFTSQIGKATAGLGKLEKGSSRAYKAGAQIGTGIRNAGKLAAVGVGVLVSQVAFGLDSLVKLEQAQAQTNAVLKSTKGIAGQTGAEITRLAEKYEALNATVGDEFIRAGENMLLTFTRIRGKAFEPALQAVLDLNTAMGKGPEGLTKTAVLVGKALNDPTKGLTALTRVGVAFTKSQVKKIKSLQKEGKLYEAQQIILGELNKEFGGSFAAQGDTTAGSVAKFGDAIEDLQRSLATALLPTVRNVADALTEFLADPEVVKGAEDLGKTLAGVLSKDNIKSGIAALGSVVSTIRGAMPAIASAASVIGGVVKTSVDLFNTLPTELKTLLIAGVGINKLTGGLVTNLAGGLISAVISSFKGLMNVNAAVVNVNGPVGGIPGAGGKGVPGIPAAGAGGGLLATAGAVAIPVTIAAIAATAATDIANADLKNKGIPGKFDTPGAGVLPFGIESSIKNLITAVKILTTPKSDPKTGREDSPATLQVEKATRRGLEQVKTAQAKTNTAIETMKSKLAADLVGVSDEARMTKVEAARGAAFGAQGITATNTGAAMVAAAVRAIPPPTTFVNVNVTANSYTTKVNVTDRYGNPNGSRNQGNTSEGGMGGH